MVGYKGCPKDATQEILDKAGWISNCNGGYGVIRDFYSFICGCSDKVVKGNAS